MDGVDVFFYVLMIGLGLMIGACVVSDSWRDDCEKIGAHISDNTVYVCFKKTAE